MLLDEENCVNRKNNNDKDDNGKDGTKLGLKLPPSNAVRSDSDVLRPNISSIPATPSRLRRRKAGSVINDDGSRTLEFGGMEFKLDPPNVVPLSTALENLRTKGKFSESLSDSNITEEESRNINITFELLQGYIKSLYEQIPDATNGLQNISLLPWNPRNLIDGQAGNCISYTGNGTWNDGQSAVDCCQRIKRKHGPLAALIFTMEEARSIVPDELLCKLTALNLPSLCYHQANRERLLDQIALFVVEGVLACTRENSTTGTIFERLVELPSPFVRSIMAPCFFSPEDVSEYEGIPDCGAVNIFTWKHITSEIRTMSRDESNPEAAAFLRRFVRPIEQTDVYGTFPTENRTLELFGRKFKEWADAVQECPRKKRDIQVVVQKLKEATAKDPVDADGILAAMLLLKDENGDTYVRPEQIDLAAGGIRLLSKYLNELSTRFLITLELYTETAMQTHAYEEYEALVDTSTRREILPGTPLAIARAWSGHRLFLTPSFFLMVAENTQTDVRYSIARAYIGAIDFLVATGNKDKAEAALLRRRIQTFLMHLDRGGSFREARLNLMPPGFFLTQLKDARVVAQNVGVHTNDFLCIRAMTDKQVIDEVLKAHGLSPYSPLDYPCQGIPAYGTFPAAPCTNTEENPYIFMIGDTYQLFRGIFCCRQCQRKVDKREREFLENVLADGSITNEQRERLTKLHERQQDQRDRDEAYREKRKMENGGEVPEAKRVSGRATDSSRRAAVRADDAEYQKTLDAAHEYYLKDVAKGKTKKRGDSRYSDARILYAPQFTKLLERAATMFVARLGQKEVSWDLIQPLFDELIIREKDGLIKGKGGDQKTKTVRFVNERPYYYRHAVRQAVHNLLW